VAVDRLRGELSAIAFTRPDGTAFSVTCTFGIAGAQETIPSTRSLLQEADEALYEAKGKGRNCVVLRPLVQSS